MVHKLDKLLWRAVMSRLNTRIKEAFSAAQQESTLGDEYIFAREQQSKISGVEYAGMEVCSKIASAKEFVKVLIKGPK